LKLIVGLGNPSSKYELNRHNVGFLILDYLTNSLNLSLTASKGDWCGCEGTYQVNDFYLMKPTTFMNNSGMAVNDFLSIHEIPLKNLLIVFDDFQIPLGTIRVRTKGSDGGHNGVSNIIYNLDTLNFPRMRIGIGGERTINKENYVDYVLSNFDEEELEKVKTLMPYYKDCILSFISKDIKDTMNKFNKNYLAKEETEEKTEEESEEETKEESEEET
jgi:PTH1 family peptidyl-tRNA hydrolase